jgi:hypothetical protein
MKSKISSAITVAGFALLAPIVSFAQGASGGIINTNTGTFSGQFFLNIIATVRKIISLLFPLVSAVLVLAFGYLVFKFVTSDKLEEKSIYKNDLIKAILAIFLWFTFFGLINILAGAVGVGVGDDVTNDDTTKVVF